jgi:hypothetical protein
VNGSPTSGVSSSSMNLKNWLTIRLDRSVDLFSLRGTEDYRKELTRREVKRRCRSNYQYRTISHATILAIRYHTQAAIERFPGSSFPGL